MLYCRGSGFELLSAFLSLAVCHGSSVRQAQGETGRSLKTRKAEHIRNVKKHNSGSNIAKHAWDNDHVIDFDNAKVIDIGNFRSRLTLESWHTAKDRNADNNSKPLPRQYNIVSPYRISQCTCIYVISSFI